MSQLAISFDPFRNLFLTGLVPVDGPAMPVVANPISADDIFLIAKAIALQTCSLTAPCSLISSSGIFKSLILDSLE